MKISILGAGVMGQQLAVLCASKNLHVNLWNYRDKVNILKTLKRIVLIQIKLGNIKSMNLESIFEKLSFSNDLPLISESSIIIESICENFDLKNKLLNDITPFIDKNAIIASNTSSLSISELSSILKFKKRFVGMHFFNPPFSCSFVEIIKSNETTDQTIKKAKDFARKMCQNHVVIDDSPGFIVNRILFPMINEAIFLLSETKLSPNEIDRSYRNATGSKKGPLELADFIGLDVCTSILLALQEQTMNSKYKPAPLLLSLVKQGRLGKKVQKGFYEKY